jgi:hypothetical protein
VSCLGDHRAHVKRDDLFAEGRRSMRSKVMSLHVVQKLLELHLTNARKLTPELSRNVRSRVAGHDTTINPSTDETTDSPTRSVCAPPSYAPREWAR